MFFLLFLGLQSFAPSFCKVIHTLIHNKFKMLIRKFWHELRELHDFVCIPQLQKVVLIREIRA